MKNAQITKTAAADQNKAAPAKKTTAAKTAPAKTAAPRTTRKAQEKKTVAAPAIVATAKVVGVAFVLTGSVRPGAGKHLFAHTEAFMQLMGMYDGKAVDRAQLTDIIGASAINYHTKTKGNFEAVKEGIKLTANGINFFKERALPTSKNNYDPKDVEAYKTMLSTGVMDGRLVKNQAFIRAIKAA